MKKTTAKAGATGAKSVTPSAKGNKTPKIISVINQKGGVGKTTTTLNLGAGLAIKGLKVLIIDLDIQCNLTHCTIGDLPENALGVCEALLDLCSFDSVIKPTSTKNLFIVPAGESLVELDTNLAHEADGARILSVALSNTKSLGDFDIVLIDNPPFISLTTMNSLIASDYYLVPLSCEYLPMLGIKWLEKTIAKVKKRSNPKLQNLGVALTMFDPRQSITKSVEQLVRDELEELVFDTKIRINTKHKAAPISHQTIFQLEASKSGKGTQDYMSLTDEVIGRLGL
jgi:chromosome partitioning protein